jgi:hypothetical protein
MKITQSAFWFLSSTIPKGHLSTLEGMVRRIEDEFRGFIRKGPMLKSGLARKMIASQKLHFLLDVDVAVAMACMIHEGVIRYEAGKPLGLSGE